tara:strand:- start:289 stop:1674 length:1386 start_codon:yes stop_codon:yes gene_type:complete
MKIKKENIYQYLFLLILTVMTLFNGGLKNLFIQYNFIIISIFFLQFIKEKNYYAHVKKILRDNKIAIYLYFIFICFLIFQTIPIPLEWLNFLSPEKYNYLVKMEYIGNFNSITLSPVNSYFNILNYLSLFLFLVIFKSLFYKKRDIVKFYFFLVLLGAFASSVAIYFYLIGNPDFLILKNYPSKESATGFFYNRTVFSCFLSLCFFGGIEYLKIIDYYQKSNQDNFFNKIYIRIFIIFITIGIITSFSRLGNFLFISLIIIYILHALLTSEKKNSFFLITLILIVLFDVLILGFYFGSERLLQRFLFLQTELIEYLPTQNIEDDNSTLLSKNTSISRGDLSSFALIGFRENFIFGYGAGSFEHLFKVKFQYLEGNVPSNQYAVHAHSDLIEFFGEFGLIGTILIISSAVFFYNKKYFFTLKNFLLFYLLLFILFFDFSFHYPLIQFIFIILLSINYKKNNI